MLLVTHHDAPPASADHGSDTEVWSATLTVKQLSSTNLGCLDGNVGNGCSVADGGLTDKDFTYLSSTFQVVQIGLISGGLDVTFDSIPTSLIDDRFSLFVDGARFRLVDASRTGNRLSWLNSGLSWSAGDSVQLKLVPPYWTGVDLYGGGLVQHSDGALTLDVTKTTGNTFKVRLTQAPTATVTITFSKLATAFGIDDFDAVDVVPETVTFDASDWQMGKTVSILTSADAAVGDSIIIGASVSIAAGANANDPYRSPDRVNGFVVTVKAGGM